MKKNKILLIASIITLLSSMSIQSREVINFNKDWKFKKGNSQNAYQIKFDDSNWQKIKVPHDWAIVGPFDPAGDSETGKLPWRGEGWYRKSLNVSKDLAGKRIYFMFDGVMAYPKVYINGKLAGQWDYGYNSFYIDATEFLEYGKENIIAVHADTRQIKSRWYPGAGIYRKVQMIIVEPIHVDIWGTYVITPVVEKTHSEVRIFSTVNNTSVQDADISIVSTIISPEGNEVKSFESKEKIVKNSKHEFEQWITLSNPELWDVNDPKLYTLKTVVKSSGNELDVYYTKFGVRSFYFTSDDGFFLNDKKVMIKGVNLHHDQGPLGAAFNKKAMRRQLEIMKSMGCNSMRNSHNIAAPEVLELCDEMGILMFDEAFDKWDKTAGLQPEDDFFEYMERNMKNFMKRDRNHPSIFIWSIGNEIRDIQGNKPGSYNKLNAMVGYVNKYDRTRPITMVTDQADNSKWRFFDLYDIHSWNYGRRYLPARLADPTKAVIISESASTVSTRGFYDLNLPEDKEDYFNDDLQISSYDMNAPWWAEPADLDFMWQEEDKYVCGEYVWTGFDYIGEPTPMIFGMHKEQGLTAEQCAKSSFFGIVDLAGIPKDRFYLYKSYWLPDETTVHILPHWNWEGNEGKNVPVFVYTNGSSAELFLNGKSLGKREKSPKSKNYFERYRLMWNDVKYEPGVLKAVAYKDGKVIGESIVKTSKEATQIKLSTEYKTIKADGEDLTYILIESFDEDGLFSPLADDRLNFSIEGPGKIVGVGNGNPHSIEPFDANYRKLFYGKAMLIVQSLEEKGEINIIATSDNLKSAKIKIESK
jgi:beta-galactosidase